MSTGLAREPSDFLKEVPSSNRVVKPRLDSIDGCRFALVFPIVVGHFARFATDKVWLLQLMTQENVLVGGFFIISGYVSAYVSTTLGERSHDKKKMANPELFFWQKFMAYYPLHFTVSTLFSPMFIWGERVAKLSLQTSALHGVLNYSLMQAWFSSEAEIWNPPTWFLSALSFANICMPTMVLPQVAAMSKDGLRKLFNGLTAISVIQKLSYAQSWNYFCKGNFQTKIPADRWNITRFNPVWALVEVTMGVAAVRDVMLDGDADRKKPAANPLWPFLASYGCLFLRLTRFNLNDALIRSCFFVPMYTKFLTTLHRDSRSLRPSLITRFFSSASMSCLGELAFPMFILHGPIGQLFYKKSVATKLWGGVMPKSFFPAFLLIVLIASQAVNEFFVKNTLVKSISGRLAKFMAKCTDGMLSDRVRAIDN